MSRPEKKPISKKWNVQKPKVPQRLATDKELEVLLKSNKKLFWLNTSLAKTPSKALSKSIEPSKTLSREEWDFCERSVSYENLGNCLIHEYAREKLKRSSTLKKLLAEYSKQGATYSELVKFQEYFSGPSGCAVIASDLEKVPLLKSRAATYDSDTKKEFGLHPKGINLPALFKEEGEYAEHNPYGLFFFKGVAPIEMINQSLNNPEEQDLCFGFFCIDWNLPDLKIKRAFSSWVDYQSKKRPENKKSKVANRKAQDSQRGNSLKSDRARSLLKSLGAARLLESMSVTDAKRHSYDKSSDKESIFNQDGGWNTAEEKVIKGIKMLFPENP